MTFASYAAKGTLIKRGNGASPEVFTTIDGVTNLSGPTQSREYIDTTHHTSAGGFREKKPSFKDPGQISFDLLWDPADVQHEGLLDDFEGDVLRNFKIVYPDTGAAEWLFSSYVSSFEVSAGFDAALTAAVTLDLTGQITRTA